jgi:hypothetical protein
VKTTAQVQKPKCLFTGFKVTRKYAYISSESITVSIGGGGGGGAAHTPGRAGGGGGGVGTPETVQLIVRNE